MHQQKNVGAVELATMSFGQSFQLSPIRLLTSVSAVINGGHSIVPHFGVSIENTSNGSIRKLSYPQKKKIVSKETSENMKMILESVVTEGSGSKASVEGYQVGANRNLRKASAPQWQIHCILYWLCPGRRSEGFGQSF